MEFEEAGCDDTSERFGGAVVIDDTSERFDGAVVILNWRSSCRMEEARPEQDGLVLSDSLTQKHFMRVYTAYDGLQSRGRVGQTYVDESTICIFLTIFLQDSTHSESEALSLALCKVQPLRAAFR